VDVILMSHDIWGFHGDENSNRGLLGCDPEDGGSMVLRNVGILPQKYTASKPRWPEDGSSMILRNVGIKTSLYGVIT